jgi:Domain of unknown function (DUF932)
MKDGRSLVDLTNELERQLLTKQDMIVPTPLMSHATPDDGATTISFPTPDGWRSFATTDNFRRQLADRLKIPYIYFERMRVKTPSLLDQNVVTWLQEEPEQRLVRTLDGRARAFLSDRYRRLDNFDLLQRIFPILRQIPDARFESCQLTDSKMYLKVVAPTVTQEMRPGDIVEAGVVIANSETGQGSLSVNQLVYRKVCSNGLILPDQGMRKTHIGRVSEASNEEVTVFKEDTLAADDVAEKMRRTIGIQLMGDPVKSVERLATRYLLNDTERSGVLRALIGGADLSGYGLVNAVTGFAQDAEDYDRSTEIEGIAGRMLDQSAAEWASLATA